MSLINLQDIETIVNLTAGPNAKIVNHDVEPFSKSRNGIMGNHYSLTIEIKESKSESTRTLKFFVKTPPDSPIMRNIIMDDWVFLEEIRFFENVYPRLVQNYNGERWSPTCYLAKPEALVFEDLRSRGYAIRQDSIYDKESLKSVLSTLARFHGASIATEKNLGKPLNQVYPQIFKEKIFTDTGKGGRSNKLAFDTMELLAERFDLDAGLVSKILNRICEIVKSDPDGINAVCHGDLWRGNIMFDDSTPAPKCILVDYQMLRYASPTIDVAMILYVHANSEFRKKSEFEMLEHYYSILRGVLQESNVTLSIPTYESILKDYMERKIVGMAYASMRWPPAVTATLNDAAALEKWYFHNRIDIYKSIMDKDPMYEIKMKYYLIELLDEGKRIVGL